MASPSESGGHFRTSGLPIGAGAPGFQGAAPDPARQRGGERKPGSCGGVVGGAVAAPLGHADRAVVLLSRVDLLRRGAGMRRGGRRTRARVLSGVREGHAPDCGARRPRRTCCRGEHAALALQELRFSEQALIVVADRIENPGNLGTLLRTADGAGAELVVVTNRRTRISHPQVFRASHGMSLNVRTSNSPAPRMPWRGFGSTTAPSTLPLPTVACTTGSSTMAAVRRSCSAASGSGRLRHGRRRGARRVAIPMLGTADSLTWR